jgi:phosphoribosylanthranilate isomerase
MRDENNIRDVSRLHPDYMGFIFYEKSPRYVGTGFVIPEDFPSTTKRVGVFVNATNDQILRQASKHHLDLIQLHGAEDVAQCEELKGHGLGVIKVFPVDDNMDFTETEKYNHAVDYFLFDTRGIYYGGNAKTFDWTVLERYDQTVPFFLSGGINPENVEGVKKVSGLNLQAIDINSGVEVRPAFKDVRKIEAVKDVLTTKI